MKIKSWNLARKRHSKANSKIVSHFERQLLDHAFARVSPDSAPRAFASKLQHCDPRAINSSLLTFSLHPARVCRAGNEIVSDAPRCAACHLHTLHPRGDVRGDVPFGLGLIYISNTGPRISRALEVTDAGIGIDDGKKRSRESLTCRPPAGN